MKILIANLGSTSFKYRLLEMPGEAVLGQGRVERIGRPGGDCPDYDTAIQRALASARRRIAPRAGLTALVILLIFGICIIALNASGGA